MAIFSGICKKGSPGQDKIKPPEFPLINLNLYIDDFLHDAVIFGGIGHMMAGSGLKDLLCCVSGKDYYVRAISLCSSDITLNNSELCLSLSWEK